jgi:ubiquinone/menaquinone biosynthesis C-methylase UbiE
MERPESIENRWDILYRDYPEVYEAFISFPYAPTIFEQIPAIIPLTGKTIADVGSGTGGSSRAIRRYALQVTGIEREPAMIRTALEIEQNGEFQLSYACGDASACRWRTAPLTW